MFNQLTQSKRTSCYKKAAIFVCLASLLLGIKRITSHYFEYKTEINIIVNPKNKILDLPAITICTPGWMTHRRIDLQSMDKDLDEKIKQIEARNVSEEEKEGAKTYMFAIETLKTRLDKRAQSFFKSSIQEQNLISCILLMRTLRDYRRQSGLRLSMCDSVVATLETRILNFFGKCFTYFSKRTSTDSDLSKYQVYETRSHIAQIMINFQVFNNTSLRPEGNEELEKAQHKVYVFLHKGNELPSFDPNDAIQVKPGQDLDIAFSKTSRKHIGQPYNDCWNYSKNFMMPNEMKGRDECVDVCHREDVKSKCHCIPAYPFLVNDFPLKNEKTKLCSAGYSGCDLTQMWIQCRVLCKPDCLEEDYDMNIRERTPFAKDNISVFTLRHRLRNDIEYHSVPVMSLSHYLCKIIMLFMVWFGISVFSAMGWFERLLESLKRHHAYNHVDPNVGKVCDVETIQIAMPSVYPVIDSSNGRNILPIKFDGNYSKSEKNPKVKHYNEFIAKVIENTNYGSHK